MGIYESSYDNSSTINEELELINSLYNTTEKYNTTEMKLN